MVCSLERKKHPQLLMHFAKGYNPIWSKSVFVIKKVKNTISWAYVISDLNGEENCKKQT